MDPTGFTIGVIGLAGLVSTCIETFQIMRSMRAFSRDTEMLFIKLDLEREIFTKWAYEVGLLKRHHVDRKLFDRRADLLIYRVLKEMNSLLSRAVGMEGKYGESHSVPGVGYHYHEKGRGSRYAADDDDGCERGKKVSIGRKFIWTVHGKEELKSLIEEVGYFNEKLNQMIPSVEQRKASLKELREAGADVATWSTLMLAEARTERGSNDDDWSDLASEVVGKAGERVSRSRKSRDSDRRTERESGSDDRRRRRKSDAEDEDRRYRSESTVSQSSRRTDKSSGSSSSHKSSRSTLVEMVGDMVGSNPRPRSTWR